MRDRAEYERNIIQMMTKRYGKDGFFNKKILELNAGEGNISAALARLGADVLAVDSRPDVIARARKKYPHIKFKQVDLNHHFPFNEQFDYVICVNFPGFSNLLKKAFSVSLNLIVESENEVSFDYPFKIEKIEYKIENYEFEKSQRKIWFCHPKLEVPKLEKTEQVYLPVPPLVTTLVPEEPVIVYDDKKQISVLPITLPTKKIIVQPEKAKIALCLSGHLRTFNRTQSSMMVNLIDSLKCDVFIHTWDTIGSFSSKLGSDADSVHESTINRLEEVYKYYNPKRIAIEKFDKQKFIEMGKDLTIPDEDIQFVTVNIGYHFSMFYGIQQCSDLRKDYQKACGFEYDYVVRFRPDLNLKTRIDSTFLPQERGVINVPTIGQYCPEGMNDQLALGHTEDMETYSNIFYSIKDYVRNHVTTTRPEALLQYHCTKNNIRVDRKNINYEIIRINNTGVRL